MRSREAEAEITQVAQTINGLLGELAETVAALNSIISLSTDGNGHG